MADKYATRSWCAGLGGFSTPSNPTELVKATELTYLNCSLVATPSMLYASNQYILQKDIKRREGTVINSYIEYVSCSLESDLGIVVDQTGTAYRDLEGVLSEYTHSGGIGMALPEGSMQSNLGYWMSGGSDAEEVDNVVTRNHLIAIPETIVIHTANYFSYDPSTLNIPLASCSVLITNTDNTVYYVTSRYFVSSCEKIGVAVDGKYKYRVEFTAWQPHLTTPSATIKEILIMFSLYGDA